MGYSQFSNPVRPREYTSPIDIDVYGRGLLMNEQNMKQSKAELQSAADSFLNIRAMSPQDEQVLNQRKAEFQESIKGLDVSSLSNPQTISKVNGLISRFSNDPDIQAIASRSSALQKDQQLQKEYEMKGKTYVSKVQRQAQKYMQDGNYYRDARFNQAGYIAPDDKDLDEVAKNTPEWERIVKSGNYQEHQKGKAINSLFPRYQQLFRNDPKRQAKFEDEFEQSIEGIDLTSTLDNPSQIIAELYPYLPDDKRVEAEQELIALQGMKNNPYIQASIKQKLRDDFFDNQAYQAAEAKTYANTIDRKPDEFAKIAVQHQNAKELVREREFQKNQYKQVANNTKIDPVRRARLVKASTELGTDISDPSQPDGYISNELLDDLGILKTPKSAKEENKEIIREDVNSLRGLYNSNKEAVTKALKEKAGKLGFNFDADDIESVEWDKDTNRYTVTVDDAYTTEDVSFTQEEIDSLKGTKPAEDPLDLFK